jgi:hypothetical protein
MKKTVFFPALVAEASNALAKNLQLPTGMGSRFYCDDEGAFSHKHLLFSTPHHLRYSDLRETMGIPKDCTVFLDSGGYQLAMGTAPKSYGRETAWAWCSEQTGIFPILDRPVNHEVDVATCAEYSRESARYYHKRKSEAQESRILNVLSARCQQDLNKWHRKNPRSQRPRSSIAEMEFWYRQVSEFDLDGWAYGGHGRDSKTVVLAVLFLLDKGELGRAGKDWLHLFGITTTDWMLYAAVMQDELNRKEIEVQLSYDSSSFSHCAKHGMFYAFNGYKGLVAMPLIRERDGSSHKAWDYSEMPYGLPLPQISPVLEGVECTRRLLEHSQRYNILLQHNLYMMKRQKEVFDFMAHSGLPGMIEDLPSIQRRNCTLIRMAFRNPGKGIELIERQFNSEGTRKTLPSYRISRQRQAA